MVVQTPCLSSTAILKLAKAGYDQKGEQCFSAYLIYTRSHFDYLFPLFFSVSPSLTRPHLVFISTLFYPAMSMASYGTVSPSSNPLSDLIRTEKAYIDTLKIIDTVSDIRAETNSKSSWSCPRNLHLCYKMVLQPSRMIYSTAFMISLSAILGFIRYIHLPFKWALADMTLAINQD